MWQELTKLFQEIRDRMPVNPPPRQDPPLLRELWQAHEQLHCLENQLNHVDRDMVEYIIFRINAAERLCTALWQVARRENLTAWGELPNPVFKVVEC
ncbi:MAG TPA: hypothetical protein VMW83_12260 [Spirochaetia bacterium]|nr:hypothetical protein [Spirochaetia bacterium]